MKKNPNIYYVYLHLWENTNYCYIGKGSNDRYKSKKRNDFWKRITEKHGEPLNVFLFKNLDEVCSFKLECSCIKEYEIKGYTLVNYSKGGEGPSGYRHTYEAKLKISERSKMQNPSKEVRKKISESKMGAKNWMYGRKHTNEMIQILREANSGKKNANHNSTIYTFLNTETNIKEICTQYDLRIKYNLKSGSISRICNKKREKYNNWIVV